MSTTRFLMLAVGATLLAAGLALAETRPSSRPLARLTVVVPDDAPAYQIVVHAKDGSSDVSKRVGLLDRENGWRIVLPAAPSPRRWHRLVLDGDSRKAGFWIDRIAIRGYAGTTTVHVREPAERPKTGDLLHDALLAGDWRRAEELAETNRGEKSAFEDRYRVALARFSAACGTLNGPQREGFDRSRRELVDGWNRSGEHTVAVARLVCLKPDPPGDLAKMLAAVQRERSWEARLAEAAIQFRMAEFSKADQAARAMRARPDVPPAAVTSSLLWSAMSHQRLAMSADSDHWRRFHLARAEAAFDATHFHYFASGGPGRDGGGLRGRTPLDALESTDLFCQFFRLRDEWTATARERMFERLIQLGTESSKRMRRIALAVDSTDVGLFALGTSRRTAAFVPFAATILAFKPRDLLAPERQWASPGEPVPRRAVRTPTETISADAIRVLLAESNVLDVAYGPDGRDLFLLKSTGNTFRNELQRRNLESDDIVTAVHRDRWLAVSSRGDVAMTNYRHIGPLLSGKLKSVRYVDARSLERTAAKFLHRDDYVENPVCRFSPDGRFLALGSKVYESDEWGVVHEHDTSTTQLALHPTEPLCLVSAIGINWQWKWTPPRILLIDLETGCEVASELPAKAVAAAARREEKFNALAWFPDGNGLVVGTSGGYLGIVPTGDRPAEIVGPFGSITEVEVSQSGRWIVFTGSRSSNWTTPLFVYDRETERVHTMVAAVRRGFDLHPTEDRFVVVDERGTVLEIDLTRLEPSVLPTSSQRTVTTSDEFVVDATYAHDEERILVLVKPRERSTRGGLELVDLDGRRHGERRDLKTMWPAHVALSSTGQLAVLGQRSPDVKFPWLMRRLEVFDLKTLARKQGLVGGDSIGEGTTLAFTADGRYLVATTRVMETETGRTRDVRDVYETRLALHPTEPRALIGWSPGNYLYGNGSNPPSLGVSDVTTGRLIEEPDVDLATAKSIGHAKNHFSALAWLPQQEAIVVGTSDGSFVIASSREEGDRGPFHGLGRIRDIAVSPSGRWIAVSGRSLLLYEYGTGRTYERAPCRRLHFHPGRDRLLVVEGVKSEDDSTRSVIREIDLDALTSPAAEPESNRRGSP